MGRVASLFTKNRVALMPRRHPPVMTCEACGQSVLQTRAGRRFCSVKCANAARNKAAARTIAEWRAEMADPSPAILRRFWSKVDKTPTCWLWTSATNGVGYGRMNFGWQIVEYAHRLAYTWAKGPIPDELEIDHLCRVRNCVNPDHLEAVTRKINIQRSPLVGHWPRPPLCPKGHVRDGKAKNGYPYCKTCSRAKRLVYLAAHREEEYAKNRAYYRARTVARQQAREAGV